MTLIQEQAAKEALNYIAELRGLFDARHKFKSIAPTNIVYFHFQAQGDTITRIELRSPRQYALDLIEKEIGLRRVKIEGLGFEAPADHHAANPLSIISEITGGDDGAQLPSGIDSE